MIRAYVPDLTAVTIATGSRYRRVEPGHLPYPYKCTGCGSTERACVDLDFQLTDDRIPRDRIGAVLLCVLCFRNVADVMNYVPVETMNEAVSTIANSDAESKVTAFGQLNKTILEELGDKIEWYNARARSILAGDFDTPSVLEIEVDMEPPPSNGTVQGVVDRDRESTTEEDAGDIKSKIIKELGLGFDGVLDESDRQVSKSDFS